MPGETCQFSLISHSSIAPAAWYFSATTPAVVAETREPMREPFDRFTTQGERTSSPLSRTCPTEKLNASARDKPLIFSAEEGTVKRVVEPSVSTTLTSKSILLRTTGSSVSVNGPALTNDE